MSLDSGQGSLSTPIRTQKRLIGPNSSTSKRSLFQDKNHSRKKLDTDADDSDIGPMSPLALSDASISGYDTSPGRMLKTYSATPEKLSSPIGRLSWEKFDPNIDKTDNSPFNYVEEMNKTYKNNSENSSHRRVSSLPGTPRRQPIENKNRLGALTTLDDIVPETPYRQFGTELHNSLKFDLVRSPSFEEKLITPLSAVNKNIPLPKCHRRKSISGNADSESDLSPEKNKTLKRRANDEIENAQVKIIKVDESSVPKARASLFQDKKAEQPINFSLSTKSFYSNNPNQKEKFANIKKFIENAETKRRSSLPSYSSNTKYRAKRRRTGEINVGVGHGIKRPKPRHSDVSKKQQISFNKHRETKEISSTDDMSSPEKSSKRMKREEESQSPEFDHTKRFFKFNRLNKSKATITVNSNMKLKVDDGKIALAQKKKRVSSKSSRKHDPTDISFDTTDLTVDDPDIETTVQSEKVTDIIKILETDWADDDFDTMEVLTNASAMDADTPNENSALQKDASISPTSELSNMTSIMNIDDTSAPTSFKEVSISMENSHHTVSENERKKYYPIFEKGFTSKNTLEDTNARKDMRNMNNSWQMSTKINGKEDQYLLDVGQKRFGATQCPECRVVYQLGDPEDENAHLNYHNSIKTLKFSGWKNERVVFNDIMTSSKIILVEPDDPKSHWKKVSEILEVVNRDLGLSDMSLSEYTKKKIYLYVREKSVIGLLMAEPIKSANRMIPELMDLDCCTAENTPAKCGINVVWTAMRHRRQGIATKLVDILRTTFYYGYIMSTDDIAFSIPTPSGKIFAEKYTKTRNFKVYS